MAVSLKISVSQYVNFKKAIRYFRMAILSIDQKHPVKHIVEWIGGPGIGKTSLLKKLIQEECNSSDDSKTKVKILWTYVNFKSAQKSGLNYYQDPTILIEFMANELAAGVSFPELAQAIQTYRDVRPQGDFISAYEKLSRNDIPPNWQDAMKKVCGCFVEFVDSLGQMKDTIKPVVFFIDESESVEYDFADWFEDCILSRLVLKKYCLIVWTGRREWRWKRPEIRNQLIRETLGHFEPDDVKEFIWQNHKANAHHLLPWVDEVHKLSGGHGYSVALAVQILDDWVKEHPGQILPASFDEMKCELLSTLRQDFVLDYAFDGLNTDLMTALEPLALLRMVDTNLVAHILAGIYPAQFSNTVDEAFSLLARLKNTDLLVWKNPSYIVGEDIRHVLNAYYRQCDHEKYLAIQKLAVSAYDELLEKALDNRNLFFVEFLYHLASQQQVDNTVNLEQSFQKHLHKYPIRVENREFLKYTLRQLIEVLSNDSELKDLSNGISANYFVEDVQSMLEDL